MDIKQLKILLMAIYGNELEQEFRQQDSITNRAWQHIFNQNLLSAESILHREITRLSEIYPSKHRMLAAIIPVFLDMAYVQHLSAKHEQSLFYCRRAEAIIFAVLSQSIIEFMDASKRYTSQSDGWVQAVLDSRIAVLRQYQQWSQITTDKNRA